MKRALIFTMILMAAVAFAGVAKDTGLYMDFKQGLTILEVGCEPECTSPPAWFEVGYDIVIAQTFDDPCPQETPCGILDTETTFTLDANLYFANANIWSYPAAYVTGLSLDLDWENWGFTFDTEVDFLANFDYWPNFVGLDDIAVNAELLRYFDSSFVAAGIDLIYRHFDPVGALQIWPYIRIKMYFN